ncbi:MAG: UDP-N-acetylglucosamine 1-carboxyvinyltransferase [Clostridiales bacterium]|nr:UDP-N-acetylglucosamine 1-carboxyvinyltransferase [Clostridiales bacterium]
MAEYRIKGGRRLLGEAGAPGSKNAALPILAATVLGGRSVIHNCPDISDVRCTVEILTALGCDVSYDGHTVTVDARGISSHVLPKEHMEKMRSSIIFAGGLLSRFGQFTAHYPGGCKLGERPINLHLSAFKQLGATVEESEQKEGGIIVAKAEKLAGDKIYLNIPSVGATQNIMLAATLAQGTTVVQNAAKEPEVTDLQNFLVAAGAKISGAGSSIIVIEGVRELRDTEYTVMPDRIVAGTYLAAAAITGGAIRLKNIVHHDMRPIVEKFIDMGSFVTLEEGAICLTAPQRLHGLGYLTTQPHPGFPTDMQPQFMAMLACAHDNTTIEETLFTSRDKHVPELIKMGAKIINRYSKFFHVNGVPQLNGATVKAMDLRGGAALVLAGLAAHGETIVQEARYIQRGYQAIDSDLQALGADIKYFDPQAKICD